MTTQPDKKKAKPIKGNKKEKPDSNNPENNPLLHVDDKINFKIETGNLLQTPEALIFNDFDRFDLKKDKDHFDMEKLKKSSEIIIVLRYYEYICTARFGFSYIIPIMESGLVVKDVFEMIKHCLRNKLIINAPSFDNIYDLDIVYNGYIKY
jgi:hypothetical protein